MFFQLLSISRSLLMISTISFFIRTVYPKWINLPNEIRLRFTSGTYLTWVNFITRSLWSFSISSPMLAIFTLIPFINIPYFSHTSCRTRTTPSYHICDENILSQAPIHLSISSLLNQKNIFISCYRRNTLRPPQVFFNSFKYSFAFGHMDRIWPNFSQ